MLRHTVLRRTAKPQLHTGRRRSVHGRVPIVLTSIWQHTAEDPFEVQRAHFFQLLLQGLADAAWNIEVLRLGNWKEPKVPDTLYALLACRPPAKKARWCLPRSELGQGRVQQTPQAPRLRGDELLKKDLRPAALEVQLHGQAPRCRPNMCPAEDVTCRAKLLCYCHVREQGRIDKGAYEVESIFLLPCRMRRARWCCASWL